MKPSYRDLAVHAHRVIQLSESDPTLRDIGLTLDSVLTDSAIDFADRELGGGVVMHHQRFAWDDEQAALIVTVLRGAHFALPDKTEKLLAAEASDGPRDPGPLRSRYNPFMGIGKYAELAIPGAVTKMEPVKGMPKARPLAATPSL